MAFQVADSEKKYLLQLARRTVVRQLQNIPAANEAFFSENLKTKTGAFVTLHKQGQLRGCIGYVEAFMPVQEAIASLAVSAAFNDPRFPTLSAAEVELVDLEISVPTPAVPVGDISQIEIGRHGLIIKQGFRHGLLLPQVATEYHWDVSTFLEQSCRKAGLPADAWNKPDSSLSCFEALIFNEADFNLPSEDD